MGPKRRWADGAVWLGLAALAVFCGVIVLDSAFTSDIRAIASSPLRLSADYSADPRAASMPQIAPVDSAVISDTQHDLLVEQARPPVVLARVSPADIVVRPTPARLTPRPNRSTRTPTNQTIATARPFMTGTPGSSGDPALPTASPVNLALFTPSPERHAPVKTTVPTAFPTGLPHPTSVSAPEPPDSTPTDTVPTPSGPAGGPTPPATPTSTEVAQTGTPPTMEP